MKLAIRSAGAHPWRRMHNLLAVAATVFATTALPAQVVFHVSLGQASPTSVSGRHAVLLVACCKQEGKGQRNWMVDGHGSSRAPSKWPKSQVNPNFGRAAVGRTG